MVREVGPDQVRKLRVHVEGRGNLGHVRDVAVPALEPEAALGLAARGARVQARRAAVVVLRGRLAVVRREDGLAGCFEGTEGVEVKLREAVFLWRRGEGGAGGAHVDGGRADAHGGRAGAGGGAARVVGGDGEGFELCVGLDIRGTFSESYGAV